MADVEPHRPLRVLLAQAPCPTLTSARGTDAGGRSAAQGGGDRYLVVGRPGDRNGLLGLLDGCAELLDQCERSEARVHLYLPGTLVEAAAWHRPALVDRLRHLLAGGPVRMVGGTYAEDGFEAFETHLHRRQLTELFAVYHRHLGVPPERLRTVRAPARAWDADRLGSLLGDTTLPNGGYRHVVLDGEPAGTAGHRPVGRLHDLQVLRLTDRPRRCLPSTPPVGPPVEEMGGRPVEEVGGRPAVDAAAHNQAARRVRLVEDLERAAASGRSGRLTDLAWRGLLTAPQTAGSGPVLLAAARWFRTRHERACASAVDLDGDGHEELVLANDGLFAVLAPARGGRLLYLATRTEDGGALVVGTPCDGWGGHDGRRGGRPAPTTGPATGPATGLAPGLGGFADVGASDDRHTVTVDASDTVVCARLVNQQPGSRLHGVRKEVVLGRDDLSLAVDYDLTGARDARPLAVDLCLSPDYLGLLDHGHEGVTRSRGASWCAAGRGPLTVWVAVGPGSAVTWREQAGDPVGHGFVARVRGEQPRFRIRVGVGEPAGARYGHLRAVGTARTASGAASGTEER
jgi:hypothetical protein